MGSSIYSTRQAAGRLAKRRGQQFESLLCNTARATGWSVIDIPDGCIPLAHGRSIRVKSPFDFVFIKGPRVLFCDAKTLAKPTFPRSQINHDQLVELEKPAQHGHKSGYIINLRQGIEIITYFVDTAKLFSVRHGSSLKPADMVFLGAATEINLERIFE